MKRSAEAFADWLHDDIEAQDFWESRPQFDGLVLSMSDLRDAAFLPSTAWLIDEVVPSGLTVLYGKPGTGKSFLALDWALSLATGRPWLGKYFARQMKVFYLNAEAEGSKAKMRKRIEAWEQDRGVSVKDTFRFGLVPVALNNEEELGALMNKMLYEEWGGNRSDFNPGLIVVDTLAKTLDGSDADGKSMSAWLRALERLRAQFQASVVVVHHPTKKGDDIRGYSSLEGAATSVLSLEAHTSHGRNDVPLTLTVEKAPRDDASFDKMHLLRSTVELRLSKAETKGILEVENIQRQRAGVEPLTAVRPTTSCVIHLNPVPVSGPRVKSEPGGPDEAILSALGAAGPAGLKRTALEAESGVRGGSLDRALERLIMAGRVQKVGRGLYATSD